MKKNRWALEFVKQAGMKLIIPKPNIVRGTRRVNKNKLLGQIACWCDLHLSNCKKNNAEGKLSIRLWMVWSSCPRLQSKYLPRKHQPFLCIGCNKRNKQTHENTDINITSIFSRQLAPDGGFPYTNFRCLECVPKLFPKHS